MTPPIISSSSATRVNGAALPGLMEAGRALMARDLRLLIAVFDGIKVLLGMRMIHSMPQPAPATVSTTTVREQPWQPALNAVGTLRAAQGAELAMDASGLVTAVPLKSGQDVKQGQLLLQLRDGDEAAKLEQLQATAKLSQLTFERARQQLAAQAISQAE